MTIRSWRRQISYTPARTSTSAAARHHAVVQVVVRARSARRRRTPTCGPSTGARARRRRPPRGSCGRRSPRAAASTSAALRVHRRLGAVDLDDQDRGGVGGVAGVCEALGRHHDAVVHHLDRRRHHAARDDVGDGRRAVVDGGEVEQHRPNRGGQRREPDAHRRHDPQRPLGAHDDAAQVEPAASGASDPDADHRRRSGSTTSSASTCADVTPYARQCGPPAFVFTLPPIEEVCWLDGSGANVNPCGRSAADEVEVRHARLDPREAILGADLEDRGHLRGHDDERVADRGGGAGEPGARSPRHDREAVVGRGTHARHDVLGGPRERHERARRPRPSRRRARRGAGSSGSPCTRSAPRAASRARRAASTSAMAARLRRPPASSRGRVGDGRQASARAASPAAGRRIVIAGTLAVLAVAGVAVSTALRGPAIAVPDDACAERPPHADRGRA